MTATMDPPKNAATSEASDEISLKIGTTNSRGHSVELVESNFSTPTEARERLKAEVESGNPVRVRVDQPHKAAAGEILQSLSKDVTVRSVYQLGTHKDGTPVPPEQLSRKLIEQLTKVEDKLKRGEKVTINVRSVEAAEGTGAALTRLMRDFRDSGNLKVLVHGNRETKNQIYASLGVQSRSTAKPSIDPKTKAKLDEVKNKIEALQRNPEELANAIVTGKKFILTFDSVAKALKTGGEVVRMMKKYGSDLLHVRVTGTPEEKKAIREALYKGAETPPAQGTRRASGGQSPVGKAETVEESDLRDFWRKVVE